MWKSQQLFICWIIQLCIREAEKGAVHICRIYEEVCCEIPSALIHMIKMENINRAVPQWNHMRISRGQCLNGTLTLPPTFPPGFDSGGSIWRNLEALRLWVGSGLLPLACWPTGLFPEIGGPSEWPRLPC